MQHDVWHSFPRIFKFLFSALLPFSAERNDESFVGGSQKPIMPPPARTSPEIPLLGPRSGKAVTPLDMGRFRSKVLRSVLEKKNPEEDISTPKQNQESGRRNPLQKEPSLRLDTPSRFLIRDQLFRPSFVTKVGGPSFFAL